MKTYKIFLKRDRNFVIQDLQVVNKGFSIWACLLQVFYLGYQKLRIQTEIMIFCVLLMIVEVYYYLKKQDRFMDIIMLSII